MILMPQIFDVTANENARYKRNELEYWFNLASFTSCFWSQNLEKEARFLQHCRFIGIYMQIHADTKYTTIIYKRTLFNQK